MSSFIGNNHIHEGTRTPVGRKIVRRVVITRPIKASKMQHPKPTPPLREGLREGSKSEEDLAQILPLSGVKVLSPGSLDHRLRHLDYKKKADHGECVDSAECQEVVTDTRTKSGDTMK